ncbi:unnamed protein product [Rotaria magnacalcarata]
MYIDRGDFITCQIGNKGEMMWVATYHPDAPPPASGDVEWIEVNTKRELQSQLKRFPKSHPVHECAAANNKKRLLHFGLYYRQHRRDGWHRGRICLLGDSCHATLPYVGQGANMAIEDAVSLATCLEKHHFLMEPAFQEYYKQRYDRTRRVVNSARYLGLLLHSQNPVISFIAKRLGPVMIQSNVLMTMTENEFYNKCPISMKPLKGE